MKTPTALIALLLSAPALADDPPKQAVAPQPFFYASATGKHCLDSGMRVHSSSHPGADTVTLTTLVETGADPVLAAVAARVWLQAFEPPPEPEPEPEPEEGAEEVEEEEPPPITRIDVHPGPPTMAQQLLAIGARTESMTTPDHTALITSVLADDAEALLALERRRIEDPLSGVTEEDVAAALATVLAEQPASGSGMWTGLSPLVFGTQTSSTVNLAAVKAYVEDAWAPGKTTAHLTGDLSGLGNLDVALANALINPPPAEGEEAPAPSGFVLIDDTCGAPVDATPTEPAETPANLTGTLAADTDANTLTLTWSLPGAWHEDHAELVALPALAERYIAEGFKQTSPPGAPSEAIVSCELLPGLDASLMACHFPIGRAKDATVMQRRVVIGLDPLWFPNYLTTLRERMDSIQAIAARDALQRAVALSDNDPEELVRAAAHARYQVAPVPYMALLSESENLDPEVLIKLARKWLNPERAVAVTLTPSGWQPDHESSGDLLPITTAWTALPPENPEPPVQLPPEDWEPPVVPVEPLPERLDAETLIALAEAPQLESAERYHLANGMQVLIVPRAGFPVVHTSLVHAGGLVREPDTGLDSMAYTLSAPHSPSRGTYAPGRPLGGQAWWDHERRADSWIRTLSGPQSSLDGLLYLLQQTTADPSIDTQLKNEVFFYLKRQDNGAWTTANRLTLRAYFGEHALGLPMPDKKGLKGAIEDANTWAGRVVHPGATTLVVIGPVDTEETKGLIEAQFGSWSSSSAASTDEPIEDIAAPSPSAVVIDVPGSTATMQLRCPVTETGARTDLLAAMLEARLWENGTTAPGQLRFDTAAAPGDIAWMSIYAELAPDQIDETVADVRTAMADLIAELEAILAERVVHEAYAAIIAVDAERRRPRIDEANAVALFESLAAGTRPPEDTIKALEELMERIAAEEEAAAEAGEPTAPAEGEEDEGLSEEALALLKATAALAAEEPEEEEDPAEEEGDEEAEPEPIVVEIVRHSPTLDDARRLLASQHAAALHRTDDLRDALIDALLRDGDLTSLTDYGQALYDVTEEDLISEIGACVGHEVITVLGPTATVTPEVTGAGFTPVEVPKKWWK